MTPSTQEPGRFKPGDRISRQADFERCQSKGRRFHSGRFVVVHLEKKTGPRRLGVIVTKKTGGSVVRNRWKRMIRECFRLERTVLPAGCDEVVIVKKSVKGSPDRGARAELFSLFLKVGAQP